MKALLRPLAVVVVFSSVAVDARGESDAGAEPQTPTAPAGLLADTLTGEAKKSYEAARVLVGADDYAGAFERFKTAYQLSKDARLLWNMAATQKNLHH